MSSWWVRSDGLPSAGAGVLLAIGQCLAILGFCLMVSQFGVAEHQTLARVDVGR